MSSESVHCLQQDNWCLNGSSVIRKSKFGSFYLRIESGVNNSLRCVIIGADTVSIK